MEEIARHARACIDDGTWQPRVDRLPYYDREVTPHAGPTRHEGLR